MKEIEATLQSLGYITETEYDANEENICRIDAWTETVLCMAVAPHKGTHNRYMVRFSTIAAFDRWANSTPVEEFFDTELETCTFLKKNQLTIYKHLLHYLSHEYWELDST